MAREEGSAGVPSTRKRSVSKKGQKTGVVVGIAAVVLVGVAGKLLHRFVRLNREASSADVLGRTLVDDEVARKSSHDLASAALGSSLHKMNGDGGPVVNGRVLGSEQPEDSQAAELNEVRGFVMRGTVQERAGVPSIRAEFKVLGAEDVEGGNSHLEAAHSRTEVPGVENGFATGHQEAMENGTDVVSEKQIVEGSGRGKEVSESQVADSLPALELVTSVSYGGNLMEVSCTTTRSEPLGQSEAASSSPPVETGSCGSQDEEDRENDGQVGRQLSLEDTATSLQASRSPLGTAPVTTCLVDGSERLEAAVAYPPTPPTDSEKISGAEQQSVSSHHADLVEDKDASSEEPRSPEELSEEPRQAGKQGVEDIVQAVKALTKTRMELAQTLVDAIEEVTELNNNSNEATIFSTVVDGKSGVVLSSSKVVLATENGTVQTLKTTTLAAAAPAFQVEKPVGEFWAYIGRGVPCTILFAFFILLLPLILAVWHGPESQVAQD